MKRKVIIFIVLSLFVIGITYFFLNGDKIVLLNGKEVTIPEGNTHWHPHLTIIINGKQIAIPSDIGYKIGRIVDTDLSGMEMSPTHTHEGDGTIHIENINPAQKPETLTLGYFFYVWDKPFNSTCLFEFCTNNGTLKMYVNEAENDEYEDYIMHDGDDIVIEYIRNSTVNSTVN